MNKADWPAFPAMHFDLRDNERGITIRDYFAVHALQAILPSYEIPEIFDGDTDPEDGTTMPDLVAKDAYTMADAMLKARES